MKKIVRNKKFLIFSLTIILAGLISASITATARTEKRSANIKSKGIIDFENGAAVIDFSDLNYLADEIDLLEDTYKSETVNALSQVSMYFNMDGSTTHDQNESNLALENADILPFKAITDGIINSQSIPTERTYTGTLPGESVETSGNISAASAENMTLGTAAWVDGELIVGTGADNNSYYSQGQQNAVSKLPPSITFRSDAHANEANAGAQTTLSVPISLISMYNTITLSTSTSTSNPTEAPPAISYLELIGVGRNIKGNYAIHSTDNVVGAYINEHLSGTLTYQANINAMTGNNHVIVFITLSDPI